MIWLCTQCEACVTRCPNDIDIPTMMDELRMMARAEEVAPQVPAIPVFYEAALRGVNLFGRMYEAGLMGELTLRRTLTGDVDLKQLFTKDVPMAARLVRDGKLKILPSVVRSSQNGVVRTEPVTDADRIAYYPGCSLHGTSKEFDLSVRTALDQLGVTLEEPEGWVCCGTTAAHCSDPVLAAALPLKNLALIEHSGHSYATAPCPLCFSRLRSATRDVQRDPALQRKVAARVPDLAPVGASSEASAGNGDPETREAYVSSADIRVEHLLTTVTDHIGYERVARAVVRPLKGLKVACY
jgi:heterodisulfide reductase subunit B